MKRVEIKKLEEFFEMGLISKWNFSQPLSLVSDNERDSIEVKKKVV